MAVAFCHDPFDIRSKPHSAMDLKQHSELLHRLFGVAKSAATITYIESKLSWVAAWSTRDMIWSKMQACRKISKKHAYHTYTQLAMSQSLQVCC